MQPQVSAPHRPSPQPPLWRGGVLGSAGLRGSCYRFRLFSTVFPREGDLRATWESPVCILVPGNPLSMLYCALLCFREECTTHMENPNAARGSRAHSGSHSPWGSRLAADPSR